MSVTRSQSASASELAPVTERWLWVAAGLLLQAVGTAIPLAIGFVRSHREGVGGHVTLATVRLIWHQMIHDHHVLPWIVVSVVVFVIGSVVIARPFCHRRVIWLIAVPLGAVAGIVILGAVALLITLLLLSLDSDLGFGGGTGSGSRRAKKHDENEST